MSDADQTLKSKQEYMTSADPQNLLEWGAWLRRRSYDGTADAIEAAAARIRELEAELAASREQCQKLLDATGQRCGCGYDKPSDICLMHGGKLMAGVRAGTHVIVPVEPTEAMLEAAAPASLYGYEQSRKLIKQYWSAMIRAALKGEGNEQPLD
jgi:hypothetical protein